MPKVLSKSTWTVSIRMIRVVRGCGRFPMCTRWFGGGLQVLRNKDLIDTRTQT